MLFEKGEYGMKKEKRVIVALDFPGFSGALVELISALAPYAMFKIGLELMTAEGAPNAVKFVTGHGGEVFFDGKFKDIEETIRKASRVVTELRVKMFNVHIFGTSIKALVAAKEASAKKANELGIPEPLVLGVTILTDIDYQGLVEMGLMYKISMNEVFRADNYAEAIQKIKEGKMQDLVGRLAVRAKSAGFDGVIASAQEAPIIRDLCGSEFKIVAPAIRPVWAAKNEQKRITTPGDAIKASADYLVVGRPITQPPPEIGGSLEAFRLINKEAEGALAAMENFPSLRNA
ncbi:MAG: orotidine-5'-phosphate decarboxylase [Candidatus Liptonbacteria bacterium]|nr:orotidine-5'-phosphate decarboxylase [Candidatus Liptonbacteria bacterium]